MSECKHSSAKLVGETGEGLGTVLVYWCSECGSLRRNMINWKYTDYGWTRPHQMVDAVAQAAKESRDMDKWPKVPDNSPRGKQ